MTKSTLATQREQDEDLCGRLVRNSGYRNENWQCIVDPDFLTQAAARIRALSEALQEACHERDGLLARADALASEARKQRRTLGDNAYMIDALVSMLGPIASEVWRRWQEKGVVRVHYSWGPGAASMTGEERAEIILASEDAPREQVYNTDLDASLPTPPGEK